MFENLVLATILLHRTNREINLQNLSSLFSERGENLERNIMVFLESIQGIDMEEAINQALQTRQISFEPQIQTTQQNTPTPQQQNTPVEPTQQGGGFDSLFDDF